MDEVVVVLEVVRMRLWSLFCEGNKTSDVFPLSSPATISAAEAQRKEQQDIE